MSLPISSINEPRTVYTASELSEDSPAAHVLSGEFMELLLAQLRNQNPFSPVDDNTFINQIIQINSLQELQEMNVSIQQLLELSQLEKME